MAWCAYLQPTHTAWKSSVYLAESLEWSSPNESACSLGTKLTHWFEKLFTRGGYVRQPFVARQALAVVRMAELQF